VKIVASQDKPTQMLCVAKSAVHSFKSPPSLVALNWVTIWVAFMQSNLNGGSKRSFYELIHNSAGIKWWNKLCTFSASGCKLFPPMSIFMAVYALSVYPIHDGCFTKMVTILFW